MLIDHLGMGGAERVLLATAPRLAQADFVLRLGVMDGRPETPIMGELRRHGITVDRLGFRRLAEPARIRALLAYVRGYAPAVVHTQLEQANVLGLWAARRLGVATVASLHMLDEAGPFGRAELRRRLESLALRRWADRIICVSEALRRHSARSRRLPAGKLVTLYNGVDLVSFAPWSADRAAAARTSLGLSTASLVLMTVAVLREPKGIGYMLEALPLLLPSYPDLRYVIVGDGPDHARLAALVSRLGIEAHVLFTGARLDVHHLLPAADVFVLPSLTEALPTVLAEAAASELPIVATAVGGNDEMVEDGITGFIVPPADEGALAARCGELLSDPGLRRRMGAAGRALARERFDLDRQARRLGELYDWLARRGRAP
jgi:glycosyltransferase involved in cell wall biosynthesis